MDPLGARRAAVTTAADAVRAALEQQPDPVPTEELSRLLVERAARQNGLVADAPTRVPASRFKDYVTDYTGTVRSLARPMPERPYRQTRLGTLFHAWVEHRSGLVGAGRAPDAALWELDEEAPEAHEGSAADQADMARLQQIFERSEWADLQPIAVEIEIDFALRQAQGAADGAQGVADGAQGALGRSGEDAASGHIVICKLDAVYRRADRGDRIEIVDWKTGKAPRTAAEKDERMLQLALYRLAYHRRFGVPLEDIDVALYYVADDLVIRGDRVYSEEELVQRWSAARAAR
jgi:DNA helicase-2/ATP-dependent DNA helicase PcrA